MGKLDGWSSSNGLTLFICCLFLYAGLICILAYYVGLYNGYLYCYIHILSNMYYIAWPSLPFKRLGSETIVLEKTMYIFIQQLYSTLIKNDIKGIYNARKYLNKY